MMRITESNWFVAVFDRADGDDHDDHDDFDEDDDKRIIGLLRHLQHLLFPLLPCKTKAPKHFWAFAIIVLLKQDHVHDDYDALLLPGEMNISEIQCKIEFNTFSFANPITVTKNHIGGTC